jgi:hypothetical protein
MTASPGTHGEVLVLLELPLGEQPLHGEIDNKPRGTSRR